MTDATCIQVPSDIEVTWPINLALLLPSTSVPSRKAVRAVFILLSVSERLLIVVRASFNRSRTTPVVAFCHVDGHSDEWFS
jgi:hypothetical protein